MLGNFAYVAKTQDGFTKADLEKLKSPAMQDAWRVQQDLLTGQRQHAGHLTKCFGRLSVRACLFLRGKQKAGRDNDSWPSLQSILNAYTKEIQDASGTNATIHPTLNCHNLLCFEALVLNPIMEFTGALPKSRFS